MTKKGKLLQRLSSNPKDARFTEVQKLLKNAGFRERQPKGGSSHYIYYHKSLDRIVTLTKGTERLPEYQVKDALRAIQRLEGKHEKR